MNARSEDTRIPPADIVYFASVDWNHTRQRAQHLASGLAQRSRVLYINPPGLRAPRLSDALRLLGRFTARRARIPPGVEIVSPFPSWPALRHKALTDASARFIEGAVHRFTARGSGRPPLLWIGLPSSIAREMTRRMVTRGIVYDGHDRFAEFHPEAYAVIAELEQEIASRADIVLAASIELVRDFAPLNPRTYLVTNAADYSHFARDSHDKTPSELARLSRPIFGYVGEIAAWLDVDLIERLSRSERCGSIVLIGPAARDPLARLRRIPKVNCLGRRPYSDLPRFMRRFDVGLIPFRISPLTTAASPIKLFEYLACGLPVLSTPLPEVRRFGNVVVVAKPERFVDAAEEIVTRGEEPQARERRMTVARENDWQRRVDSIWSIFGQHGVF
jgi:glycosyltransferase involved in cell wall biosynthesis